MKAAWLFAAIAMACVSCGETSGTIDGYDKLGHATGHFRVRSFGYGKHLAEIIPFGVRHSVNLDIGFKAFAQMVGAMATAIYYGEVQLAKQVTAQMATAGLTQEHIAKINADLQQSIATNGLERTKAAINAGLFTPAGVAFKE